MRYPESEKLEIIRTVEASHLPARQTLSMLGIPRTTHYRWYDRWRKRLLHRLSLSPVMVSIFRVYARALSAT